MINRQIKYLFCLSCLILFGCSPARPAGPVNVPAITPIPGWHTLENAGFQIWVPPSYLGGSMTTIDTVIPQLTEKDPGFAKVPQSLKQRGTPFIAFAVDINGKPDNLTYMLVENEKLAKPLGISDYLDLQAKNLTAQSSLYNILKKEVLASDRYPIGRMIVELNTLETGDIKQVVYVVKNGGTMWQISFTTPADEFDGRSPVFEQIARSATIPYTQEAAPSSNINPWVIGLIALAIVLLGFGIGIWIYRRRKVKPVQTKRTAARKKTKK